MMDENEKTAASRHLVVGETEDAGARLDVLLAARLPALSRSRIQALIKAGHVSEGARTITEASHRVKPGQSFAIFVPESEDALPLGEAIPLTILHEDEYLIVIDKPAGLVVHPAPGNATGTLVNALIAHCGDSLSGIGGVRRPGIVHRLDKDTSGVMVAAKTDAAYAGLQAQFATRTIERAYAAMAWGMPQPRTGEIEGAIGRSPRNRKKMAVVARGGKRALTRYRVTRTLGGGAVSLLECRLETGRTHQIRVHLASRGHAILGDPLYGAARPAASRRLTPETREAVAAFPRQALHAATLGFVHPGSGKTLRFKSEIPSDMSELLEILG